MSGCLRHREWKIVGPYEDEGGEVYIFGKCKVCGQTKSALVDFTRSYSNCGPCASDTFEQYERELRK